MESFLKHTDISECVAGLVLEGKMSADYVIPSYLAAPYDIIISKTKDGKTPAELLDIVGLLPIQAAREAAHTIKFTENTIEELLRLLMSAYRREEQIKTFKDQIRVLERGENIQIDKIVALMDKTEDYKGKYVRMSDVEDTSPIWRRTYYPPIDEHLGDPGDMSMVGIPESGLTILAGPPGVGKTSLIASMIAGCAENGKKVLMYTLEMTTGQIARRIIQVATRELTVEQKSNVIICGEILSADEVYADAMRLCNTMDIYSIFIDFSDLLIEKEEDEKSMAYVYRRCATLAKKNTSGSPVVLLSQLNRNYTGGIPKINHLRYTGLAEALGALILLIYNPNQIFATQGSDDRLPAIPGTGYLIVGKCLGKGTKVLKYDGSLEAVENIKSNDLLMGIDSTPRKVLSTTKGYGQLYLVKQNSGVDYVVNEHHVLSLRSSSKICKTFSKTKNVSIKSVLLSSKSFLSYWKGYKVPVDFPEKDTPIDPYLFGLWLGDGSSKAAEITMGREDSDVLLSRIKSIGQPVVIHSDNRRALRVALSDGKIGGKKPFCFDSIQSKLRILGVLGNKHIPDIYLKNSRSVRLALLAGLIDSDGYKGSQDVYEITQKNKLLLQQIKFLCNSLGLSTGGGLKEKMAQCQTGAGSLVYRLTFTGDLSECPIALERKRQTRLHKRQLTGLKIEDAGQGEYYGFELDGDHLFLLEDMTVTHNSRFGFKEGGPGAIQIDFDGKTSWGKVSHGWFNLNSV